MPRNVRNFWIDVNVDGRESAIGTGPRAKDGGMNASFYIRSEGDVEHAFYVLGRCINGETVYRIQIPGEDDIIIRRRR
jgi:hypothetical protein